MSVDSVEPTYDVCPNQPIRIYIDCTQTCVRPVSTGIPRVVRNLIKWGRKEARKRRVELLPIRFNGDGFERVQTDNVDDLITGNRSGLGITERFAIRFRKLFVSRRMRASWVAVRNALRNPSRLSSLPIRLGDIVIFPDSSWGAPMWAAVDRMRQSGAVIGVLQHDFIPLRHPEMVPKENHNIFRVWVDETLSRADFVMAVSDTVADEVREELRARGRDDIASHAVSTLRNGSDFAAEIADGRIRQALKDFFAMRSCPAFLTVGTLEPRKNQIMLLDAIDGVLAKVPHAKFLFAGIVGWRGKDVAARVRSHTSWGRSVMHFPDLSDRELHYAYKHASATICPSLAEGYGLPIVEAIARGTRVFASDIPVHREVGGSNCVFFDPRKTEALSAAIIDFCNGAHYVAEWPPKKPHMQTWQETAATLVNTAALYSHQGRALTK